MTVSSYLELYTTFIGWHFFSVVTELLAVTGVIWLPLIFLVLDSVKKARSSMHANAGAVAAYEQVETNAFMMIVMMVLVLYPIIPFQAHEVRVTGAANCTATEELDRAKATAADDAYPALSRSKAVTHGVKVPVWWGLVFGLSGGVTHGVSASLPCSSDLSSLSHSLNEITIADPELKEEYIRFVNECYIPVQSKIGRMETRPARLQQYINERPGDVYWPGGRALIETEQLYPWFRATHPVRGWPFREKRDKDLVATVEGERVKSSRWGKPFCKEWWLGEKLEGDEEGFAMWWRDLISGDDSETASSALKNPNEGLKRRLVAYAEEEFGALTLINTKLSQDVGDVFDYDVYADALVRRLVRQTPGDMTSGSGIGDSDEGKAAGGLAAAGGATSGALSTVAAAGLGASGAVPAGIGALIGGAAVAAKAASELAGLYAQVYILKKGLPIIQALLLMLIVMFLPFAMVLGNYDLGTIIPASVTLMAIKFFSAIWVVLGFLQSSLMSLMFPEETSFILGADVFSINAILLGLIFGFAHLGAIYVLFKVLSWGSQGANFGEINIFGGGEMGRSAKSGGTGGADRGISAGAVKKK